MFAVEGAVLEEDASESASMHFSLLPFGYRILSAESPKPEDVFEEESIEEDRPPMQCAFILQLFSAKAGDHSYKPRY